MKKEESTADDLQTSVDWVGLASRGLTRFIGSLPLWLNRSLGAGLGRLGCATNSQAAKVTRINYQLCFPGLTEQELEQSIKQSMVETGRVGTEMPAVWLKPYSWLASRIINVKGRELLDQRLEEEPGLIVLAPHFGNWEVFGPYLTHSTTLTALYQPPKLAAMESLIREARERWRADLVPTNRKGVMALFKALKAGGTTIILPDQVPDQGAGEFAPFYGVPALTMTLVHNLIKRTGSRVVMAYALRVPGGFDVVFEEPDEEIYSEDTQTSLAAMNRSVEACVNACPSQYQWEYKRFKKQPEGSPKVYPKKT